MKVSTCTSCKELLELHAEIHGSIAVNSFQIELTSKDIIQLSDVALILSGLLHTGVKDIHIKFTLSAGTYSIEDFNAKVKVALFQQRQDWEVL